MASDWLSECVEEAVQLKLGLVATHRDAFDQASLAICRAILGGKKVMACGNGGSASDASHCVGEMLGRFQSERASLPAVSLVSDPATVTAIGNDYGYEKVFSRQIEGLGMPGDVLMAISTSGGSANVVEAARTAQRMGIHVIGLMGKAGCRLANNSSTIFSVPGSCAARIQEVHIFIIHTLCAMIDRLYLLNPTLWDKSKAPLLPVANPES